MRKKLIILDRDGVLNEDSDDFIKSPDEWHPVPGSLEAVARLVRADYLVAVATNQSGVGRGLFSPQMLDLIHDRLAESLAQLGGRIDFLAVCPHHPDAGCSCRKPRTGLLDRIGAHFQRPLQGVWFVGDSVADLAAARAAGCEGVLVLSGKGRRTLARLESPPRHVYRDLADAVDHLLAQEGSPDA